jgi:hypothetical protein
MDPSVHILLTNGQDYLFEKGRRSRRGGNNMIRIIKRIKVKMAERTEQDPEIREELMQIAEELNRMTMNALILSDMAEGIIRRLDGDE